MKKSDKRKPRKSAINADKVTRELKKQERRKRYFTKEDQLSRIQKYEEKDKKNKYYKPFQGSENFRGPKGNQHLS